MKKFKFLLLTFLTISMLGTKTYAEEKNNNTNNKINFIEELRETKSFDLQKTYIDFNPNAKEIVIPDGMENYINPVTKEYFIMEKQMYRSSSAKHFTFSIRHRVVSSAFYLSSTNISVHSSCRLIDNTGHFNGNPSYRDYCIVVSQGWGPGIKNYFPINSSDTVSYGGDWSTSTKTYVSIENTYLDAYEGTLDGEGDVMND